MENMSASSPMRPNSSTKRHSITLSMHLRVPSSPSLSSSGSFLRITFLSRSRCLAFAALMRAVRLRT